MGICNDESREGYKVQNLVPKGQWCSTEHDKASATKTTPLVLDPPNQAVVTSHSIFVIGGDTLYPIF